MFARFLVVPALVVSIALGSALACQPEKPPGADEVKAQREAMKARPAAPGDANTPAGAEVATVKARFNPAEQPAVMTYAGERGRFADTSKLEDIPEPARGMVRINLLDGPRAPAGTVWVANLAATSEEPGFPLETVPRELFEELALGMGRSSKVELPGDLEPPDVVAADAGIVVYKTDWCGVCKKLTAYLDRMGVTYVAKDIEKDRAAASELSALAKQHNVKMGSVPMISIAGELLVGFDRKRIESLLAG